MAIKGKDRNTTFLLFIKATLSPKGKGGLTCGKSHGHFPKPGHDDVLAPFHGQIEPQYKGNVQYKFLIGK